MLIFVRLHWFRRNQLQVLIRITLRGGPLRAVDPFPAMIAKEIFDDSIFQGMKSNDSDARAGLESVSQNTQALFERAEFVIHFHTQRLKNLRGRMTTTVPAHGFFDRIRQRESFAKRRCLAHLNNQARDTTRGRFLPEIAKQVRQLFAAVLVNDCSGSQLGAWIHAHIEGTFAHDAEAAFCIFELPRRDAKVKKRTADSANSEFVEDFVRMPKIRLPHGNAAVEPSKMLGHMLDRFGILIQGVSRNSLVGSVLGAAASACPGGAVSRPRWVRPTQTR